MPEIALVPINSIIVGMRHRQDLGDLDALANSINSLGLLQPIGVDSQMNLVFGQRRLEACRSLEWESISARVVDVPSLLAERDENEVRKDFTHSERVAIGLAVESSLGERRGRPVCDKTATPGDEEIVDNCPQFAPGQKTREVAAHAAGYGNYRTYERAKAVVEHGTPALIDAMDKGEVSVSAAAMLAKLPEEGQKEALSGGKEAILDQVQRARDTQLGNGEGACIAPPAPAQSEDHPDTPVRASPAHIPMPTPAPAPMPEQEKAGLQVAMGSFSGKNEWYTPAKWIELARQVMGSIDVDPASNAMAQQTVQATRWYDQEKNGLQQEWPGNVWLNPPYARGLIDEFIRKLLEQFQSGSTRQAIVLVDNRTDTRWFHTLCSAASAVAFTKGRVNFYNEAVESSSPVYGSAFVYFGPHVQTFKRAFDQDCLVLFTRDASSIQEISHGP